jgi:hypothetical protein
MDPDRKMLTGNIEIKLTVDGKQWYVAACSANIENKDLHTIPPGEVFSSKDAAIMEMKRRIMEWLKEKGRAETEEKVKWRVP